MSNARPRHEAQHRPALYAGSPASDVFSYTRQREPGAAGAVFFRFVRRLYAQRALLLALVLPFDLVWIALDACAARIGRRRTTQLLLLTAPPAAWLERLPTAGVAWIGAPQRAVSALRHGGVYLPASPLYVLLTLALFLPQRWQPRIGDAAVRLFAGQLRLAGIATGALVHHSDALPLGRAAVLAARRLRLTTVCIQHGIFHASSAIVERDGCLSALNVVRSALDGELIAEAAPTSHFLVEPDFFIPSVAPMQTPPARARVTLLGEGWHQCDAAFGERYLARLRQLAAELIAAQVEVVFRPHPCERGRAKHFGFARLDVGTLATCLAESAVVIGYSSTALHEAASVGLRAALVDVDGAFHPAMERNGLPLASVRTAADVQALLGVARTERPAASQLQERQRAAAWRVLDAIMERARPAPGSAV